MSDRWQLRWRALSPATVAFVAAVLTLCAFGLEFYSLVDSVPGYRIFAQPGIALLRCFSEELGFAPKLLLLLLGQYVFYCCVWWLVIRINRSTRVE